MIRYRHPAALTVVAILSGTLTSCDQSADDAAKTCLTGKLTYDHHDAEAGKDAAKALTNSVARNANWELRGKTSASGRTRLLASGVTDRNNGTFHACSDGPGPLPELYVRFRSSSTKLWRVIGPASKTEFTFETRHLRNVTGSNDLGSVKAPADQQGAWKIVDTLNDLYRKAAEANSSGSACWTRHQRSGKCDRLTFTWAADATKGGYWDPGSRNVVLEAEDANSKHLILHEAGHWLQFELYGHRDTDAPGCDGHPFDRTTTRGCAWTEGFADAVAAYSLGDYRYVYGDGSDFDLHNDPNTPWDKGDAVQGRIGSSLLDLWAKDGPDGGSWNKHIQLMTDHHSTDFNEYFTADRPKAGLPTTDAAKQILDDHTITY
ncbi:metalloprotease [Streptomyces sp. NPDC059010]|uniref:metalloprotease n=1 Tax=Streptomyces sp. NPDC059010 TaxID=3346695 RepID=UPI0036B6C718